VKKNKKAGMFLSLGIMAVLVCGCGAKKMENTEVPKSSEPNEAVQVKAVEPVSSQKYTVQAGDTLWAISQQSGIYSDSFQWPLLFKGDRDQIQDPDKISPGQVLTIQKGQTDEQIKHARQLASDTPAFVHHDDPRSTLPIDYF
jgi:LysM repeat protein